MTDEKPTPAGLASLLGGEVEDLPWQMSGRGAGMFQVAIVRPDDGPLWVLVRLQGSPDIQVYSRHEWECFLDGVKAGEFDDLQ